MRGNIRLAAFCLIPFLNINSSAQEQWWQREQMHPSSNQILNNNYLTKRRELERMMDQKMKSLEVYTGFLNQGQDSRSIRGSIREQDRVISRLEHELSSIPVYVNLLPNSAEPIDKKINVDVNLFSGMTKTSDKISRESYTPSNIPPSEGMDRIMDEMLRLIPDKSDEAIERIRTVFLLLPDNYDYSQNKLIRTGRIKVLKHDIRASLKKLPDHAPKKPVQVVYGGEIEGRLDPNRARYTLISIPNTYILFADGSKGDEIVIQDFIRWHNFFDGWSHVTNEKITNYIRESDRNGWNGKETYKGRYVDFAEGRFKLFNDEYGVWAKQMIDNLGQYAAAVNDLRELTRLTTDTETLELQNKISVFGSRFVEIEK